MFESGKSGTIFQNKLERGYIVVEAKLVDIFALFHHVRIYCVSLWLQVRLMESVDYRPLALLYYKLSMLELLHLDKLKCNEIQRQLAKLCAVWQLRYNLIKHKLRILFMKTP